MTNHSINWHPTRRELQWFAGLLIPFACVVAGVWWFRSGTTIGPLSLIAILTPIGLIGLAVPESIHWLYVAWMIAVWPIGWLVSHVLLGLIFWGVILPIGLMLRALGRDPMQKGFDRNATTYWIERSSASDDTSRYFRQF